MTATGGAEEDFGKLYEESLRTVKAGDVVRGRVVLVTREQVTVDIGYKSEGQISIREFLDRDGRVLALRYDQVDEVGAYLRAPEPATFYRMHGALTGAAASLGAASSAPSGSASVSFGAGAGAALTGWLRISF